MFITSDDNSISYLLHAADISRVGAIYTGAWLYRQDVKNAITMRSAQTTQKNGISPNSETSVEKMVRIARIGYEHPSSTVHTTSERAPMKTCQAAVSCYTHFSICQSMNHKSRLYLNKMNCWSLYVQLCSNFECSSRLATLGTSSRIIDREISSLKVPVPNYSACHRRNPREMRIWKATPIDHVIGGDRMSFWYEGITIIQDHGQIQSTGHPSTG